MSSTPALESHEARGETSEFQDVYDTHFVIAEARLELVGIRYTPAGRISEGVFPGKPARFIWSLHPESDGDYSGTVWLQLRFIPREDGPESQAVLTAQLVDIPVMSLFGLNGTWARALGSVGVIVALVITLDDLLPWIWRRYQARMLNSSRGTPKSSVMRDRVSRASNSVRKNSQVLEIIVYDSFLDFEL